MVVKEFFGFNLICMNVTLNSSHSIPESLYLRYFFIIYFIFRDSFFIALIFK